MLSYVAISRRSHVSRCEIPNSFLRLHLTLTQRSSDILTAKCDHRRLAIIREYIQLSHWCNQSRLHHCDACPNAVINTL